jgi:hypothetical protein
MVPARPPAKVLQRHRLTHGRPKTFASLLHSLIATVRLRRSLNRIPDDLLEDVLQDRDLRLQESRRRYLRAVTSRWQK